MKKKRIICFDMDGTIADLLHVKNWKERLCEGDFSPYLEAAPMVDMLALNATIEKLKDKGYEIRIISWLSKEGDKSLFGKMRKEKIRWLAKYHIQPDAIHLVEYGREKMECLNRCYKKEKFILIDDNAQVRESWKKWGGETIDPTEVNLIQELEKLLEA
jgi:phosphoglycolate phosphatase-like HAD superfamily hydrolase